MAGCASTVKRLSLELGGNAPFIVFNSADVKAAVKGMLTAKFRNTGQVSSMILQSTKPKSQVCFLSSPSLQACTSANRLLVQSGIHDQFVEVLSDTVRSLKLGDGFQEGVVQGPLINNLAVEKVATPAHEISVSLLSLAGGTPCW